MCPNNYMGKFRALKMPNISRQEGKTVISLVNDEDLRLLIQHKGDAVLRNTCANRIVNKPNK